MNTTNYETLLLSKKGFKELKKHIVQLERDKIRTLLELRDLDKTQDRENRLIRAEKLINLESLESELSEKHYQLSHTKLLPSKRDSLRVILGSVVDLIDRHGHLFRYKLVDSVEANPSDGRISTNSPLGQNLLGKTLRDTIENKNGNELNCLILIRIF